MATYKVIQDVEAEDKLLGPLTLRQFIYAGIAAILLYLCYFSATHHGMALVAAFFPLAAIFAFFAFPWGRDQPTEIWALAKIRYLLKPRRRIWDQSGARDLVTVTAPKKRLMNYTNGLSETEVQSRLRALADTIDSRGWAIKNANLNLSTQPSLVISEPTSDRLLNASALPQQVSDIDVQAADDILDEKNNARAQAVDTMIEASTKAHRAQIMQNLRENIATAPPTPAQPPTVPAPSPAQPGAKQPGSGNPQYDANNYWFLNQPGRAANVPANMVTFNTQIVTPGMGGTPPPAVPVAPLSPNVDEQTLVQVLDAKKQELPTNAYYSHLHTIQPLSTQPQPAAGLPAAPAAFAPTPQTAPYPQSMSVAQTIANGLPMPPRPAQNPLPTIAQSQQQPPAAPVTPSQQAAILQLANNNDLNVATLAREADRATSDEVVIKLH